MLLVGARYAVAAEVSLHNSGAAPSFKLRVLHIPLQYLQPSEVKRLIKKAADAKFNAIILAINGMVALNSLPAVIDKAWSKDELRDVAKYTNALGIKVIPEVKLLSHQKLFFAEHFPDLMFDHETYDPNNPAVYKKVLPILDELVELLHPSAIHIGHDEVNGAYQSKTLLGRWKLMLPAVLFTKDVLVIYTHLRSLGVETWMWGDMLLGADEFPDMERSPLNGGAGGYGKKLRIRLPKDIVICDWHYADKQADFPSLRALRSDGFRVLGATYLDKNTMHGFSQYASQNGGDGMIATLWVYPMRKDWETTYQIIRESGAVFNRDFPDEK
ncbi:family 20 glycosylhydrolase [Ferriphaselus amnicola]|nr:family 20 glycosylhydrolase [Ferriphaselus amnicola]